jgi:hypothetical protein
VFVQIVEIHVQAVIAALSLLLPTAFGLAMIVSVK